MSPDPIATVRGLNVLATVDAFQLMPEFARKLLARHGISVDSLRADQNIVLQRWLDVLREVADQVGEAKLRSVGSKIAEKAVIPPSLPTVESVLLALDDVYRLNHVGRVGRYRSSVLPNGHVVVECETPYPRAFERGLVEGMTRHPGLAKGKRFTVEYREGKPGSDRTCTLEVIPL